jgi:hypothetical protein
MKMLLAVPALALLATPAMARPADLPPGSFKADYSVRMSAATDGRGDRGDAPAHALTNGKDAYDLAHNPSHERTYDALGRESHFQAPIKAEAAMKMQKGDNREGSSKAAAAKSSAATSKNDRMGREQHAPPVQLKTQVVLRMQNGDSRESSGAKSGAAARPADHASSKPLSRTQRDALCHQSGVCLPVLAGSDDVEDKTE